MLAPLGFARRYTRTEREKGGDPSSTVGLARVACIIHKSQEGFFPSSSSFFLPQSHSMERERGAQQMPSANGGACEDEANNY